MIKFKKAIMIILLILVSSCKHKEDVTVEWKDYSFENYETKNIADNRAIIIFLVEVTNNLENQTLLLGQRGEIETRLISNTYELSKIDNEESEIVVSPGSKVLFRLKKPVVDKFIDTLDIENFKNEVILDIHFNNPPITPYERAQFKGKSLVKFDTVSLRFNEKVRITKLQEW